MSLNYLPNWLGSVAQPLPDVLGRVVNPGTVRPLLTGAQRDPRNNSEAIKQDVIDLPPGYGWTGNMSRNGNIPPGRYPGRGMFVWGPWQLAGLGGRGKPTAYVMPEGWDLLQGTIGSVPSQWRGRTKVFGQEA
jgi:hypothetical protein